MRKPYFYLSAVFLVLQGQTTSGHGLALRTADQRPQAGGMATEFAASEAPKRPQLVQSNPVPPAPAAPPAGATLPAQRTETINYENWIVTCREFLEGAKKRNCAATVALQRSESGQTVVALNVQLSDQGKITASVQTLTGVAIAPGVEVKLDKAGPRKAAFDFCEPARCVASLAADGAFIRDVSAAATVSVVVQSPDGKPVNLEFPIKGFDKAYTKMTKG